MACAPPRLGPAVSVADAPGVVARMPEDATPGAKAPAGEVLFPACSPVRRIFDAAKAREVHCGFLGFRVASGHRFEPGLHLSGHCGDACPGSAVFVETKAILARHDELVAKRHACGRPGLPALPRGTRLAVRDPFGNRLRSCEPAG